MASRPTTRKSKTSKAKATKKSRAKTSAKGRTAPKRRSKPPPQSETLTITIKRGASLRNVPEDWHCIDCGFDTAPGWLTREELKAALARAPRGGGVEQTYDETTEIYMVEPEIWNAAGMDGKRGCLCIGCLEKRFGRRLTWEDFPSDNEINVTGAGTPRLMERRGPRRLVLYI
jgi:hypothetical protein